MRTITRTVITLDLDAQMLIQGRFTIHEAMLDGDEDLHDDLAGLRSGR